MTNFRRNLMYSNNKEEYKVHFFAIVNEQSKIDYHFTSLTNPGPQQGIGFTLSVGGWGGSMTHMDQATPIYPCKLEVVIKDMQKNIIYHSKMNLTTVSQNLYRDGNDTPSSGDVDITKALNCYSWNVPHGMYDVEITISSKKILFSDNKDASGVIHENSPLIEISNFSWKVRDPNSDSKNPRYSVCNCYCFQHLLSINRTDTSKFKFTMTKPPLPAPTNLTLAEDGSLSWDAVKNAESYVIQITNIVVFDPEDIYKEIKTNNTSENIKDYLLKWGNPTTYYIRVYGVPKTNSIYINGEQASTSYTVS